MALTPGVPLEACWVLLLLLLVLVAGADAGADAGAGAGAGFLCLTGGLGFSGVCVLALVSAAGV
jgi:hypothetical protein